MHVVMLRSRDDKSKDNCVLIMLLLNVIKEQVKLLHLKT